MRGRVKVSEFVRKARAEGWTASVRPGGHLELSHPLANEVIITAATPSDHRWLANTRARMRRALPAEPKPERVRVSPKQLAARPRRHERPTPVVDAMSRPLETAPPRRLPGGPAGYRSPWAAWW